MTAPTSSRCGALRSARRARVLAEMEAAEVDILITVRGEARTIGCPELWIGARARSARLHLRARAARSTCEALGRRLPDAFRTNCTASRSSMHVVRC